MSKVQRNRMIAIIDKMGYEEMLGLWRFGDSGNELFQGNIGVYFSAQMKRKRDSLGRGESVAISKRIGWNRD